MVIESLQNTIVKQVSALKQRQQREKSNLFVVEGIRFVDDIPNDWNIEKYVISESFADKNQEKILNLHSKVYTVTDAIFMTISDTQNPQGILALCTQKTYTLEDILKADTPFLLIADQLQDPGNLGTIIRVADAAGVTGVILSKGCVDLYNPKVLRATMGSVFHIPIVTNANILDTISALKSNHIITLSAHLKGKTTPYEVNLKQSVAIIVGNEANGISDDIAAQTDALVKLPMPGLAESLNVSIASGILLYEVVRQRLG
jgi:TrmH family RNA methyltransferase